jgi:23S rRNA pseudouridine2604 synthase
MCSRREADRFIEQGLVAVDGVSVTTLGIKILPSQKITLDRRARNQQSRFATVLINKPLGFVSGLPEKGYQSAVILISQKNRQHPNEPTPGRNGLAPAGRLDIDSTGLMVFTQDGRVAKMLVGPESDVEKEYITRVQGTITADKIKLLRHGLHLDGKVLKPARVENLGAYRLGFTLTEGRKRQIRRMCELVDLKVTRLTRIRIGKITLGDLPLGKWRLLQPGERF